MCSPICWVRAAAIRKASLRQNSRAAATARRPQYTSSSAAARVSPMPGTTAFGLFLGLRRRRSIADFDLLF